jgi:uncharacterized protein (DUF1778 family)
MTATALAYAPRKVAKQSRKDTRKGTRRSVAKDKTLSLRIDPVTQSLIDRAAEAVGQNRSDFLLTSAREKATHVLLDQRLFGLSDSNWSAFVEALDNAPPPNAKLKALLSREPIWDRQD